MSWTTVMCPDGPYQMNTEGVGRLIRSYAYARAVSDSSELKTERYVTGLTDFLFAPNVTLLQTDWDQVPKKRDQTIHETGNDFFARMSRGMSGRAGMDYLEGLVDDRDEYTSSVLEQQRQATKETMANIAGAVSFGETVVAGATLVRDAAAETELVLASIALAPAAFAGEGLVSGRALFTVAKVTEGVTAAATAATGVVLGSVGKGAIKWEDTGSISQGLVEGYTELAINSLTVGIKNEISAARKVEKIVVSLVFGLVKGGLKTATSSYVSPEDMARGKKKSLAEILLPALSNIPSAVAKDVVETLSKDPKWAVPATVAMKLLLKYGASAAGKATQPAAPPPGRGNFAPIHTTLRGTDWTKARMSVNATHSSCLFDCAKPSERFVTESALRPMSSF